MKHSITILAVCVLVLSIMATAQVPQKISYQGLLTNSVGTPVQDGSYNLRFDIYNLPSAGTLRYTQTLNGVSVTKGTFSVILGPLSVIFSESLYVQVTALAGSPGIGSDITFSPRSELTSAPYALAPWTPSDTNIYYTGGNVLIGTTSPHPYLGGKLHVKGGPLLVEENDVRTNYNTAGAQIDRIGLWLNLSNIWGTGAPANSGAWIHYGNTGPGSFTSYLAFETYRAWEGIETMRLLDGNVGIGTTNPTERLEVNGNIKVGNATIHSGTGSPEGVVMGNIGDLYLRTDGGSGTTLYVKESGNGTNTGWIGK